MQYFLGDGSPTDGPLSELDGYMVTYHYDHYKQEYVVRLHHSKGSVGLCGCSGEDEAKVVTSSIAAVIAIADCTFTEWFINDRDAKRVECNNLVEYDAMKDIATKAIGFIKSIAY